MLKRLQDGRSKFMLRFSEIINKIAEHEPTEELILASQEYDLDNNSAPSSSQYCADEEQTKAERIVSALGERPDILNVNYQNVIGTVGDIYTLFEGALQHPGIECARFDLYKNMGAEASQKHADKAMQIYPERVAQHMQENPRARKRFKFTCENTDTSHPESTEMQDLVCTKNNDSHLAYKKSDKPKLQRRNTL